MSFNTVLALIGINQTERDTEQVIALSSEIGAHLSVVAVRTERSALVSDDSFAPAWLKLRQKEIEELTGARQRIEELCQRSGLSFDVAHLYDEPANLERRIGMRALYADIVIFGEGMRSDAELREATVTATVFDSGTPLLLGTQAASVGLKPKNVLLAWDSRPQAARAAKAAMEMLVAAETVHVVLVDPDTSYIRSGAEPGADMAAYLARHGCKVVVEQRSAGGRAVEEILRQHALELGADLMVMGAYGHSRLRERIFGGVTASILERCAVPVLMCR
jgi:nucleotide-binding universal stress UspA family protein